MQKEFSDSMDLSTAEKACKSFLGEIVRLKHPDDTQRVRSGIKI